MMIKLISRLTSAALCLLMFALPVHAQECDSSKRTSPINLTASATVNLPLSVAMTPVGTVLYKKEASLAQLTGNHREITGSCASALRQQFIGRINGSQSGQNVFATSLVGLGLRLTAIYDKPGQPHKEWPLPFNTSFKDLPLKGIMTDDIKIRLEAIKTGDIESGTLNLIIPSVLSLTDNSLIVSLSLKVITPQAHCSIIIPEPQVELPPIDAKDLLAGESINPMPVNINLKCLNTRKASLSIEGVYAQENSTIFKNMETDSPAEGVGIQMLYNGIVMIPGHPIEVLLIQKLMNTALPISVRYAKSGSIIKGGNVKSQITLHLNYL